MLRRLARPRNFVLIGTGTAIGAAYYQNDYSLSDIGLFRFMRAGFTATAMAIDYKIVMSRNLNEHEYKDAIRKCHQRGADRILTLCKSNGGVFIKVGQHIASLQYLLPEAYTDTLSVLHSKAPESNLDDLRKVFSESIGKDLDEVFTEFDVQPIGAASLAQVHKARLRSTGDVVAVKIQHPKVLTRSLVDIASMDFFLRVAHKIFPDFHLMWLVEETKKNLPKELDFVQEAENAQLVKQMFRHLKFLKVPKIYREFTSNKVLTMEFCEGIQINDVNYFRKAGIDTHDICRKIGRLYSEMIFKLGIIHADPHPGNVLVQQKGNKVKIVLLDHGLYSKLEESFRVDYCKLWMALLKPDKDKVKDLCTKMGVGELFGLFACIVTARSYKSVTEGITNSRPSERERREIQDFAASLMSQITQVLDRMPRSMLLILKTNDLLRAIERRLQSHRADAFLEMTKCCSQTIYEHKLKHTTSRIKRFQFTAQFYWIMFKIYVYQAFLTCNDWLWRKDILHLE